MKYITFIFSLTLLYSCSIEKRIHTPGYHIKWNKSNHNSGRQKLASKNNEIPPKKNKIRTVEITESNYKKVESEIIASINSNDSDISVLLNQEETILEENCDLIIFRDDREDIYAKILEIGVNEITYKNCNDDDGPLRRVLKKNVLRIEYSNGEEEWFREEVNNTSKSTSKKNNRNNNEDSNWRLNAKTHAGGVVGFIFSMLGLILGYYVSWPLLYLGFPAFILGIAACSRKKKYPKKYKNPAWGVLSIIFGILLMIASVIFSLAVF